MQKYKGFKSWSIAILASAIVALIKSSRELSLREHDIKEVLYALAQQDWRDHRDDHRQLELFPLDNYTSKRGGVK